MAKINPADTAAREIMDIQQSTANKSRISDIIAVAVSLLLVFGLGIAVFALPHKQFSEQENRDLAIFPELTASSLTDGSFTLGIGDFYADQFPLRSAFVGIKAVCELASLKGQNNSVLPAADNSLVKRLEYTDYSNAEKNLSALALFEQVLAKEDIPLTLAVAPRSVDVLAHKLSPLYGSFRSDRIWEVLAECRSEDVNELRDTLTSLAKQGEYVWYNTDHHWTTDGAYAVYLALADDLGYTPRPLDFFVRETVSEQFYGTTYSSSGMYWSAPDSMVFYRFEGDSGYTVKNMITGDSFSGFYVNSYLEQKDKYSAFLGGNQPYITVTAPSDTPRPRLLVIKDSFAHSLIPFLAIHFDIEMLDLRSYNGKPIEIARECDAVLVLMGADNLALSDDLSKLGYGIK